MDATNLTFVVPFNPIPGPHAKSVLYATQNAKERWLPHASQPDDIKPHKLPVHQANIEQLRIMCKSISENRELQVEASVSASERAASSFGGKSTKSGIVTTVYLHGAQSEVWKMRGHILRQSPLALRCATVDLDADQVLEEVLTEDNLDIKPRIQEHLSNISKFAAVDVFVVRTKFPHDGWNGNSSETSLDDKIQIKIYGDYESVEVAKVRVLVMIDEILGLRYADADLELSLHPLICGRTGATLQHIKEETGTNIYFPVLFPEVYGYKPPFAQGRNYNKIIITGEDNKIQLAHRRLWEVRQTLQMYVKDVKMSRRKIDYILLDRLDDLRRIMSLNASFIQFPKLGEDLDLVRVQATELLHIERTIRALMNMTNSYYYASWHAQPDIQKRQSIQPSISDIGMMLTDIAASSRTDIWISDWKFEISGSDDGVKHALEIINEIPFLQTMPNEIHVKIELCNDYKEFVSGKKNGKLNKIMQQAHVQIIFENYNEYNFFIDVGSANYPQEITGLGLVEQELPAAISFYVPDRYHKRIIGVGGAQIQRIMKKYSVFVKFSNAMDQDIRTREEKGEMIVDNVVCRTPARNAANLDLVKEDIMAMVAQVDAEHVSEIVVVPRLIHRNLLSEKTQHIHDLQHRFGCKIEFPSTEMASDLVTVSGPEYQVPMAVQGLLELVPDTHEVLLPRSLELAEVIKSVEFDTEVRKQLLDKYNIAITFPQQPKRNSLSDATNKQPIVFKFMRSDAPYLTDSVELLRNFLVTHGVEISGLLGAPARPTSDFFDQTLPFFESKLLSGTPAPVVLPSNGSTKQASSTRGSTPRSSPKSSPTLPEPRNGENGFAHPRTNGHAQNVLPEYLRDVGPVWPTKPLVQKNGTS